MRTTDKLWTREELILAINLYCRLPFGKFHKSQPDVVELARLIGRTPSSVGLKLGNLASFDPALQARGIKGAPHSSKLDKAVWDEFFGQTETTVFESELLRARRAHTTVEKLNDISEDELPAEGKTRERLVKTRVNQSFFRSMILADYDGACCITGISERALLVASHIRPWAVDEQNRLNPRNGLALNALHDRAFDAGLLTITPDYTVLISAALKKRATPAIQRYFTEYDGKSIKPPRKFPPDLAFLAYHNEYVFKP